MTASNRKTKVTTDMDYLTKLIDEADSEGKPLFDMVDDTQRKYLRKTCFLAVDYAIEDLVYRGFIKDISVNGVFIDAKETTPVGGNITMAFSSANQTRPVKISGMIVRSAARGIGVALTTGNQSLRTIVESLG